MDFDVQQMILESGERWLAADMDRSQPRNAVLITDHPARGCYELTKPNDSNEWVVNERKLTIEEIGEFFHAFGSHYGIMIDSLVRGANDQHWRICKFIKNGNDTRKWSISLDTKNPITIEKPQEAAIAA